MGSTGLPLLQGTLDMMILQALASRPRHGYGVLRFIRDGSEGELGLEEGALYPALHRLELKSQVEAEWGVSENNRQAKYYRLTEAGRRRLVAERETWERYVLAVSRVLRVAEAH
jgi:PadR family transcriptional regulator